MFVWDREKSDGRSRHNAVQNERVRDTKGFHDYESQCRPDTDNGLTRTYERQSRKEIDRDPAGFTGRTTDNTARTARQSVELRRTKMRNGGDIITIR